jgi:hypothetical protein
MMRIDLTALDQAATGNPKAKVTVNKAWLREVHRLLVDGERAKARLAASDRHDTIFDSLFGGGRRSASPG